MRMNESSEMEQDRLLPEEEEKIDLAAQEILERFREAFEELAK